MFKPLLGLSFATYTKKINLVHKINLIVKLNLGDGGGSLCGQLGSSWQIVLKINLDDVQFCGEI